MSTVLLVDGNSYFAAATELQLKFDHVSFLNELENVLCSPIKVKYFFCATANKEKHKVHNKLSEFPPTGPNYEVVILNKKTVSGNRLDRDDIAEKVSINYPEGVDVALATKLIECSFGLNGEEEAARIVIVTAGNDLLPAILSAESRKKRRISVLVRSTSQSEDLKTYFLLDKNNNSVVYLDELMRRCGSANNRNKNSSSNSSSSAVKPLQNIAKSATATASVTGSDETAVKPKAKKLKRDEVESKEIGNSVVKKRIVTPAKQKDHIIGSIALESKLVNDFIVMWTKIFPYITKDMIAFDLSQQTNYLCGQYNVSMTLLSQIYNVLYTLLFDLHALHKLPHNPILSDMPINCVVDFSEIMNMFSPQVCADILCELYNKANKKTVSELLEKSLTDIQDLLTSQQPTTSSSTVSSTDSSSSSMLLDMTVDTSTTPVTTSRQRLNFVLPLYHVCNLLLKYADDSNIVRIATPRTKSDAVVTSAVEVTPASAVNSNTVAELWYENVDYMERLISSSSELQNSTVKTSPAPLTVMLPSTTNDAMTVDTSKHFAIQQPMHRPATLSYEDSVKNTTSNSRSAVSHSHSPTSRDVATLPMQQEVQLSSTVMNVNMTSSGSSNAITFTKASQLHKEGCIVQDANHVIVTSTAAVTTVPSPVVRKSQDQEYISLCCSLFPNIHRNTFHSYVFTDIVQQIGEECRVNNKVADEVARVILTFLTNMLAVNSEAKKILGVRSTNQSTAIDHKEGMLSKCVKVLSLVYIALQPQNIEGYVKQLLKEIAVIVALEEEESNSRQSNDDKIISCLMHYCETLLVYVNTSQNVAYQAAISTVYVDNPF